MILFNSSVATKSCIENDSEGRQEGIGTTGKSDGQKKSIIKEILGSYHSFKMYELI